MEVTALLDWRKALFWSKTSVDSSSDEVLSVFGFLVILPSVMTVSGMAPVFGFPNKFRFAEAEPAWECEEEPLLEELFGVSGGFVIPAFLCVEGE